MRVAFDSRPAADSDGIARYTRSLLAALIESGRGVIVERGDAGDCALFHAPWIDGAPLRSPVPAVVTLHDLVALKRHGEYLRSGLRFRMRCLAVQRATRVIVPTRFVADDAVRALRIEPERIDVIPEAPAAVFWPRPVAEIEAVRERFGLPDRYLLWVGGMRTPDPSKRVAALARTPRTLPLVLVGPTSRWARELPGVQLTGQVSDDELAAIYSGAHALVFPGHEDGFGLPAVEALACGTPVAACDGPALREVLEDRIAFSPRDDLAALVRSAELLERPAPAPPPWSWADVAQTTWKVYERALEQGSAVRPARRGGVRRRERVERR